MKKDGLFNVTMGAYDAAEVCELVGTFSLDKISVEYDKNSIGLYHDNGLFSLLRTCQHLLKNGFQTILLIKKYFKNQLFIMKIH